MAKVVFTNKAKSDLKEIWEYTFETWSVIQADKYYSEIIECCQNLLTNFDMGKSYSNVTEDLKGIKTNRHIIFYRCLIDDTIEIERILHQKMEIKRHIK
jgi:toxin ParE1/3/4